MGLVASRGLRAAEVSTAPYSEADPLHARWACMGTVMA